MTTETMVYSFVDNLINETDWDKLDRTYLMNKVCYLVGEIAIGNQPKKVSKKKTKDLVDSLIKKAIENKKISEKPHEIDCLKGQLFDLLTPTPSEVNKQFNRLYLESAHRATDYFFELGKKTDYIKTEDIAKNIVFPCDTDYGELSITINLSKPEKDPKQIASSIKKDQVAYPKCMLCMENEGYSGRDGYPNRFNHRIIRKKINDEKWGFQYSPYAYFQEHCIFLSGKHQPMKINKETFIRLISIIDWLPHYFVGSNADLPIVGGSILSHDHYQGGNFTFPIEKMPTEFDFSLKQFPTVKAGIVKWPMSVIRISSDNRKELVDAAEYVLKKWDIYSDESLGIVAKEDDGTRHHTITPIARRRGELFELDLVLRDNNVSEEFPDGIFHPHQELHHIKKENIGLIEVMGLAVLPPRLDREMEEVKKYLLKQANEIADYHLDWAKKIRSTNQIDLSNVQQLINNEIGKVFLKVLENAGVYKRDESGQNGFKQFVQFLQRT